MSDFPKRAYGPRLAKAKFVIGCPSSRWEGRPGQACADSRGDVCQTAYSVPEPMRVFR